MNSFSCVITGHRPTRFKFKYNEKDKRCQRIKKCLQEQLIRLYNQGVRCFWAGGAMGADMWASEILLHMKEQTAYQDVELCLALPFEGYDADWDDWHRKRMKFIRKYAAKVLILGEMPSSENYKKRNYFMVDQVGCMVAVYDNVSICNASFLLYTYPLRLYDAYSQQSRTIFKKRKSRRPIEVSRFWLLHSMRR